MTIIVVDPNNENSSELVDLLQEIYPNDTVVSFQDPLMSIKYGGNNPVDIIFAEAEMRRADGFALFETFKKLRSGIKTVITANDDLYIEKATASNVNAYLRRPITPEIIKQTVTPII